MTPTSPKAQVAIGKATPHLTRGQWTEALGFYDEALALDSQSIEVLHNRAIILQKLMRLDEALQMGEKALAIAPKVAELHHLKGSVLQSMEQWDKALICYQQAAALNLGLFDTHNNMGSVLREMERYEEALQSCKAAIALRPESAEALDNYACALVGLGHFDEAFAAFDKALRIAPDLLAAHNDRSNALYKLGRYEEAIAGYDNAIRVAPQSAAAHSSKGSALQALGRQQEAAAAHDEALRTQPNSAFAQFNKATHLLLLGDFKTGWKLYESRWTKPGQKGRRNFTQPLWLGDDIKGKTILLHAEQGLGDAIQFCRYAAMVKARGAKVVLEMFPPLMVLMGSLAGVDILVARNDTLPAFDVHCPLMSLPLALGTMPDTIPHNVPYLAATDDAITRWQQKLGAKRRPRIGLVWSGTPKHTNDRNRSMSLATLAPLLAMDLEFHALQKELCAEDTTYIAAGAPVHLHSEDLSDMNETAALIQAMDIVISVDTSVAHLAGALAKSTFILLPFAPDHRWLLGRNDSTWYPTATLVRQPVPGDWQSVVINLASLLTQRQA